MMPGKQKQDPGRPYRGRPGVHEEVQSCSSFSTANRS